MHCVEMVERAKEQRNALIESMGEVDDDMMEAFLEERDVSADEMMVIITDNACVNSRV